MANFLKNIFIKNSKLNVDQLIIKKTVISFFFFFVFAGAAFWGWKWLRHQSNSAEGTRKPLRTALNINESIFSKILSDKHLTKEYDRSQAAQRVRVNGKLGLRSNLDTAAWNMYVVKTNGDTIKIKVDDLQRLPKTEVIFNFKCIEGWNQVTYWGGVRFSDFVKAYGLEKESALKYVGLSTPDKEYYVGIDMGSAMHPQTIVCYEMNGQPLPLDQGYPLRLIIPVKYGIKHLKRIGTLFFDNNRPPDYWYERGYDYFSGL